MLAALEAFRVELVERLRTGWTRGEPTVLGRHLDSADRTTVPRGRGEDGGDRLACELRHREGGRRQPGECSLLRRRRRGVDPLVYRIAELTGDLLVQRPRIAASARGHLRGEPPHDQAVLVRRPGRPVQAEERGARAFFAGKSQRAIEQAVDEVLEAYGHLDQAPAQARHHAVEEAAADDGLAHPRRRLPPRPTAEEAV